MPRTAGTAQAQMSLTHLRGVNQAADPAGLLPGPAPGGAVWGPRTRERSSLAAEPKTANTQAQPDSHSAPSTEAWGGTFPVSLRSPHWLPPGTWGGGAFCCCCFVREPHRVLDIPNGADQTPSGPIGSTRPPTFLECIAIPGKGLHPALAMVSPTSRELTPPSRGRQAGHRLKSRQSRGGARGLRVPRQQTPEASL